MKFFAEFTPWEILEIFSHKNAYYCLQVRANKETGMKYFRTTLIIETESASQMKNINVETINRLLHNRSNNPVPNESIIKPVKGGKMKLLIESSKQENPVNAVNQLVKRQRKFRAS